VEGRPRREYHSDIETEDPIQKCSGRDDVAANWGGYGSSFVGTQTLEVRRRHLAPPDTVALELWYSGTLLARCSCRAS
jgi:hypothetical protein